MCESLNTEREDNQTKIMTILEKKDELEELLESLNLHEFDGLSGSVETEFVKVLEDGETWPVFECDVEDLIESGEIIKNEITIYIGSTGGDADSLRDEFYGIMKDKVIELELEIESESKFSRNSRFDHAQSEIKKITLK